MTPSPSASLIAILSVAVAEMGRYATEEVLIGIRDRNDLIAGRILQLLEVVPGAALRVVGDVVLEVGKVTEDRLLVNFAQDLRFDPRSPREASRKLKALDSFLSRKPEAEELVLKALDVLEDRGALGVRTIERISRFLKAVYFRPGQIAKGSHPNELVVGDESISLDVSTDAVEGFSSHDDLWGEKAVEEVLGHQLSP